MNIEYREPRVLPAQMGLGYQPTTQFPVLYLGTRPIEGAFANTTGGLFLFPNMANYTLIDGVNPGNTEIADLVGPLVKVLNGNTRVIKDRTVFVAVNPGQETLWDPVVEALQRHYRK